MLESRAPKGSKYRFKPSSVRRSLEMSASCKFRLEGAMSKRTSSNANATLDSPPISREAF
jgi:hypothetical protein